jgi:hypothetical protein
LFKIRDWYNLEKSKRVKAFRCGEFDACIEKAEATQGTLVKKREKYARREDAILHALELERKQLASMYQTQGFRPGSHGNISGKCFWISDYLLHNLVKFFFNLRSCMNIEYTANKAQLYQ